jgi:uridylate kinase
VKETTETDTTAALSREHVHADQSIPHRRVLLKLSGEVFGGGKVGVDPEVVKSAARFSRY